MDKSKGSAFDNKQLGLPDKVRVIQRVYCMMIVVKYPQLKKKQVPVKLDNAINPWTNT